MHSGPFYHRIFPYKKFVMLDADLKFRIDIAELYDHFENFNENQIMGVAVDLAPHYRIAFRKYRENHPDTKIGEPGRLQVRPTHCTKLVVQTNLPNIGMTYIF